MLWNIRSCRTGLKGKKELGVIHELNVPGAVSTRQGRPWDPTMWALHTDPRPPKGPRAQLLPSFLNREPLLFILNQALQLRTNF